MEDKHRFKLYVNAQQQKFWEILEMAKEMDTNPSQLICDMVIDTLKNKKSFEFRGREVILDDNSIIHVKASDGKNPLSKLIEIADGYRKGTFLRDKNIYRYLYDDLYLQGKLSKDDIFSLLILTIELYSTLTMSFIYKDTVVPHSLQFIKAIETFDDPKLVAQFKRRLYDRIELDSKHLEKLQLDIEAQKADKEEFKRLEILAVEKKKRDEIEDKKRQEWSIKTGRPKEDYYFDDVNTQIAETLRDGGEIINGILYTAEELKKLYGSETNI